MKFIQNLNLQKLMTAFSVGCPHFTLWLVDIPKPDITMQYVLYIIITKQSATIK